MFLSVVLGARLLVAILALAAAAVVIYFVCRAFDKQDQALLDAKLPDDFDNKIRRS